VTITAVLRAAGTSSPTGFVQIVSDGIVIGTVARRRKWRLRNRNADGQQPDIGWHVITATYLGDAGFAGASSAPTVHLVRLAV